jgi:hypothetical protein
MWLSIKATLQIKLVNFYGEDSGLIIYKSIMALIMNSLLSHEMGIRVLDSDLKSQVIKKLARRIYKLNLLFETNCEEGCRLIVKGVIQACSITIKNFRNSMQLELDHIINSLKEIQIDPSQINTETDIIHHLKDFNQKIDYLKSLKSNTYNSIEIKLDFWHRNKSSRNFPKDFLYLYENENYDSVMQLYEIENWSWAQDLDIRLVGKFDASSLFKLLDKYQKTARNFYNDDELGNSRMILASIKIACLLDKLACEEFYTLSEHKFGITSDHIQNLLLLSVKEIECARQIKVRNSFI